MVSSNTKQTVISRVSIGLVFIIAFILMTNHMSRAEDTLVKIGVLAKRGTERCLEKWSPTAEYLTEKIPGKTFETVPLDFMEIYSAVENGEVDFILANSSFYVELESYYGINRIATLKNFRLSNVSTTFGGVIFCKANRSNIRRLADLKGKTFMGVEETSFGGWRMAWREFKEKGIDPYKDFESLTFGGIHDAVVYAVRDGKVDAGTVRTDTLERMTIEGKINLGDFHVIHEHGGGKVHLPFLHSTRSYPEWPIAKIKHTPGELAEKVTIALLEMPKDCAAAKAAICAGWTIPLDYKPVHECLKELKLAPYKDLGKITSFDVFREYWEWILTGAFLFAVLAGSTIVILRLNRNINSSREMLKLEVEERNRSEDLMRAQRDLHVSLAAVADLDKGLRLCLETAINASNMDCGEIYLIDETSGALDLVIHKRLSPDFVKTTSHFDADSDNVRLVMAGKPIYTKHQKLGVPLDEVKVRENLRALAVLPVCHDGRVIGCLNIASNTLDEVPVFARNLLETIAAQMGATITVLKSKEEHTRLVTAIEQAAECVVITDRDGTIQYVNPAFEAITGYSREEAIGQNSRILKGEKHSKEFYAAMWDTLTNGRVWSGHFINKKKDGTLYEEDATISPIKNASGEIINFVAVKRDVTEEIKLEEKIRQSQKMESIGTLAGGIAHDFNNILSAIIGYSELSLDDASKDSMLYANLQEVLKAGSRAKDLVKQILVFSRQGKLERKPIQVSLIVKEALKLLRASLSSNIDISQNTVPTQGQDIVLADPTQIHQILMNLCTNAAHAMQEKGGVLEVGIQNVEVGNQELGLPNMESEKSEIRNSIPLELTPGPYLRLTVNDTGCGMSADVMERIFDPYFTTKEKGVGTGLGLATVHGIVKKYGGTVTVYSEPGKGSIFSVYLPVIQREEISEKETEEPIPTGNERVLFVDDEQSLAQLGKQMLSRLGYEVETRTSSVEALQLFWVKPDNFDLVITDMTMPNMTGDDLVRELLHIRPDIPIIMCTGFSEKAIGERTKEMGIRAVVMKPLVMRELAETIRRVL